MSAFLRRMLGVLCLVTLVACQEDGTGTAESTSLFPDLAAEQSEICTKEGGRWGETPSGGAFTCFRTLPDANKSCSTQSDCEGLCLARSRTCSPIEPLFGCNEVLSSNGLRQTRCTQ